MDYINKVMLRGNVGSVNQSKVGDLTCIRFSIATTVAYRANDGKAVVETTWHSVIAWSDRCPEALLLEKNDKAEVTGRLRQQRYVDADGCERSVVDIIAAKVTRVEDKSA